MVLTLGSVVQVLVIHVLRLHKELTAIVVVLLLGLMVAPNLIA